MAEVWVVREGALLSGGARVTVAFESEKEARAFAADLSHPSVTSVPVVAAGGEQPRWEWWSRVKLKVWGREVVSPNPEIRRVRGALRLGKSWLCEAHLSAHVTDNEDPAGHILPIVIESLAPDETQAMTNARRHAEQIIKKAEANRG